LCIAFTHPQELLEPLLQLRARRLEEQRVDHVGDAQGAYAPLPCADATAPRMG
jgi:hypothetical protein